MATTDRPVDRMEREIGTPETKPSWKTTELLFYLFAVAGVLIASAVIDKGEDGQFFTANRGWTLVTYLTIGYMISRGLAKLGNRYVYFDREPEPPAVPPPAAPPDPYGRQL